MQCLAEHGQVDTGARHLHERAARNAQPECGCPELVARVDDAGGVVELHLQRTAERDARDGKGDRALQLSRESRRRQERDAAAAGDRKRPQGQADVAGSDADDRRVCGAANPTGDAVGAEVERTLEREVT